MKPDRVLFKMKLFNERKIATGLFYAEDRDGHGRLHDGLAFLGFAMPTPNSKESKFTVKIWGDGVTRRPFQKNHYLTQKEANEALVKNALRLLEGLF